jgi:hypothetical protein
LKEWRIARQCYSFVGELEGFNLAAVNDIVTRLMDKSAFESALSTASPTAYLIDYQYELEWVLGLRLVKMKKCGLSPP